MRDSLKRALSSDNQEDIDENDRKDSLDLITASMSIIGSEEIKLEEPRYEESKLIPKVL